MPSVTAGFFGPIKRPWPEHSRRLEFVPGSDIAALLADLGYSPADMRRVAVVRNGRRVGLDARLEDGDDVRFVLLAGGG
ncbi:MAG: hypothetical protein DRI34_05365 [Deltaproteobacteria bacterium]|nr:MAG: hypothetical protein DRI34_05365 [Deltaproteobacteria bacterium]